MHEIEIRSSLTPAEHRAAKVAAAREGKSLKAWLRGLIVSATDGPAQPADPQARSDQ